MTLANRRRTGAWAALFAAVWIGMSGISAGQGGQDRNEVARMTEKMKTVCVGRFLVDVPEDAEVTLRRAFVDGFDIVTRAESQAEFEARIAARETEINATPNELGKKNMEAARPIKGEHFLGKLFVFGRWGTSWAEGDRQMRTEAVAVEAHVRADGATYSFSSKNYDPKLVGNLPRLLAQLVARAESDIPAEPGFCIDRALIRDPLTADQAEAVTMFAGLPAHPDLALVFSTMAGTRRGPGLLARSAAASARQPFYVRAAFKTLREGMRSINGLAGEELAVKVTEANFTTGFNFDWEMGGKEDDVRAPLLTLELQSGISPHAGGKPVQSSLSESALAALWDKVSASIRLRQASAPKPVKAEPPVAPLGTQAYAGEPCPQSGWWQCGEGGNGVGVLGGQRQYLKKGQRMPQALLLPPQTLWQKVRGLQPSYESNSPSPWKLVDKRTRSRLAPPAPLAQPGLAALAGATVRAASAPGVPEAPLGSFVRTGLPCPASGWWRCEESHALDGTRWFARGSVLPAATFRIPPGAFGRARGAPQVIQRRSSWQLVRYAQAPQAAAADAGGAQPKQDHGAAVPVPPGPAA